MAKEKEEQLWDISDTIENLKILRDVLSDRLLELNNDGKGESDACELRYDLDRAIMALEQENQLREGEGQTIHFPFRIGDTAYIIRDYHGVPYVREGEVSQIYLLKCWEKNTDKMMPCATIKGYGRGIIGKKVFKTQEEAECELKKKEQ